LKSIAKTEEVMGNLKLVETPLVEKQARERNIVGIIHRHGAHLEDSNKLMKRRYTKIDNAILGLTRFMLMYGYVGDVCEVFHFISGRQLGTIKITSKGSLKTSWIWD